MFPGYYLRVRVRDGATDIRSDLQVPGQDALRAKAFEKVLDKIIR
jgi:hypothetical protein